MFMINDIHSADQNFPYTWGKTIPNEVATLNIDGEQSQEGIICNGLFELSIIWKDSHSNAAY